MGNINNGVTVGRTDIIRCSHSPDNGLDLVTLSVSDDVTGIISEKGAFTSTHSPGVNITQQKELNEKGTRIDSFWWRGATIYLVRYQRHKTTRVLLFLLHHEQKVCSGCHHLSPCINTPKNHHALEQNIHIVSASIAYHRYICPQGLT